MFAAQTTAYQWRRGVDFFKMVLWSAIGLLVSIGSTFRPGITLHCSDYKQPPPLPPALLYTIDWSAQRKRADLNCPATLQLSRYTETKALELSGTEPTHSRFDFLKNALHPCRCLETDGAKTDSRDLTVVKQRGLLPPTQ